MITTQLDDQGISMMGQVCRTTQGQASSSASHSTSLPFCQWKMSNKNVNEKCQWNMSMKNSTSPPLCQWNAFFKFFSVLTSDCQQRITRKLSNGAGWTLQGARLMITKYKELQKSQKLWTLQRARQWEQGWWWQTWGGEQCTRSEAKTENKQKMKTM